MNDSLIKAYTLMALGQYTNAIKYFKSYMNEEPNIPLSKEAFKLLSKAYNKLTNYNRNYIRELEAYLESLRDSDQERIVAITSLLDETRKDLIVICTEVVNIINNNLLKNVVEIREKVLIYNMKGDYCRYIWEVNNSDEICKEATKAYNEAMGICQWNFKSTDPYLLQVTLNFTTHLNNTNNTERATVILKRVIQNLQTEDVQHYDLLKKSYIDLVLKYLKENLVRFQNIINQKNIQIIQLIEEFEINDYLHEELLDNLITRKQG
ncbi:14-3-3 protein beta/alpha-B-like [Melanaphis sacchari]|uniref:14-3-3 protein beta/alpha-B-like n=1 Tax=Melanaphis sacchari TaxID=742174 RepID=UPI000DC13FDD|nr:14-3-3 protein beta/alpha-B-like [Melanaphis sacchari]